MRIDLSNKPTFFTGGSKGIGKAIAEMLIHKVSSP
jgi:NAD(P)-dependent dehydrogenase (short-subunit alcohol dehydrogenase family)